MWRLFSALLACALSIAPLSAAAQTAPVVGPKSVVFTANGQSNVWSCTNGQNSFQLHVPSGLTGTISVGVSQSAGGPFVSPPWAFGPGSAVYASAITNSGDLSVALNSNLYVQVSVTAYSSGSTTVIGTCSNAQAAPPPVAIPLDGTGDVKTAIQNFPTTTTVTQGSGANLHINCDSGCGGSAFTYYPVPASTLCSAAACVVKASAGTLAAFINLSTSPQSGTCTLYDNASAASGQPLFTEFSIGASQVITFGGSLGLKATNGITLLCTAAPTGSGLLVLYN
jgi:hypothetical protein